MGRYTGVMNQQADAMSENLAGSEGRINNPVPYGARNAYSPLGGERELRDQQRMTSGVPSEEEILASNKAQVDGMRKNQAKNNAAMQERPTNRIQDPKKMRIDMQSTTDAYNIYKRKGGTMMFRQWAKVYDETNGMSPDVKLQFAQNYPGIWDQQKIDPASTDIDAVAPNSGNTAAGKIAKRRAGLLRLNGMPPDAPTPQAVAPNQVVPPSLPMQGQSAPVPAAPQAGASKYGRYGAAPPVDAYPQRETPPVATPAQPPIAAPQTQRPSRAATAGTQSTAPNFTDLIYKTKDAGKRRVITALQGMYSSQPPEVQSAIGVLLNPGSDDTAAAKSFEYLVSVGIDPAQLEKYQHQGGTRKGKNK
jgi:hypothetical protein